MSKSKALLFDLSGSVSYGRLSLLGKVLWPMLIIKSDDQGRGLAEADVLKWRVCPNVPELPLEAIIGTLGELASPAVDLILLYEDSRQRSLYQIIRWWEPEIGSGSCLLWARPSEFEAPPGWTDRVRVQRGPGRQPQVINWDQPGGFNTREQDSGLPNELPNQLPNSLPNPLPSGQNKVTKPNLTEDKIIIEAETASAEPDKSPNGGAIAPPAPPKPKAIAQKYTEGQRQYLALWGAKRFRTIAAADAVLDMEKRHGTKKLLEAARWAAEKQMTIGDSVHSVETALGNWGQPKKGGGNSGPTSNEVTAADAAEIRAQLRRSRPATNVEATGEAAGAPG